VILQTEPVKQRFLLHRPFTHHPPSPALAETLNQRCAALASTSFSTLSAQSDINRSQLNFDTDLYVQRPLRVVNPPPVADVDVAYRSKR
jgi:hypothetical protein